MLDRRLIFVVRFSCGCLTYFFFLPRFLTKGQVPPYAQPQITQFAVQEAIIKTVEAAVEAYGLQSLPGSEGEVQVHENVSDLAKAYKTGDSIQFTATLNASYDPQKKPISSGSRSGGGGGTVVDVEATTVEVEAAVAVEESIVDVDATVAVQESIVAEVEANVGAEPEATVEAEA